MQINITLRITTTPVTRQNTTQRNTTQQNMKQHDTTQHNTHHTITKQVTFKTQHNPSEGNAVQYSSSLSSNVTYDGCLKQCNSVYL